MAKYQILAVTGCLTGIVHTYITQKAMGEDAKKQNVSIKVETHGQTGINNNFTAEEIEQTQGIIIV